MRLIRVTFSFTLLLFVAFLAPHWSAAQSIHDKCNQGDASSCLAYGRALATACGQVPNKSPREVLQCQYGAQCYQDKGLAMSQGNKARADASCDTGGVSTALQGTGVPNLVDQKAFQMPAGQTTLVNWWLNSTPNLTPSLIGGGEDDSQNIAFDQVVRLPLHLCAAGFLVNGKVVMVPGKWLNDRCNAVWANTYLEEQQFMIAERWPPGTHGYWGALNSGPVDKLLWGPPGDDGTKYLPCMVHYPIQKDGVDRALSALIGDDLVVQTGNQLGYVVGTDCRFEFGSHQVDSGDNVRVYYLKSRPVPPPIVVKAPSVAQPHPQGRGTEWSFVNQRQLPILVYTEDTPLGVAPDCRREIYRVTIDPGGTWVFWVDDGKVLDVKFFEDTQGNGGCSANAVGGGGFQGLSTVSTNTYKIP
jgi:hypothetical protein